MEKRKKLSVGLLFDDTLDSNDGVAQQVKRLGEWLNDNGHNVLYLCGETKINAWHGSPVISLSKNIKVKFNGNIIRIPLWSRKQVLKEVLDEHKIDVIHVTMPYSPLMAQRVIRLANRRNIPVIATFHILPSGMVSRIGTRLLGLIQHYSLKTLSHVTAVSAGAADFLKSSFGLESKVIPNMIEISKFKANSTANVPNRIVFLGRLVPRKGCKELIKAFSLVRDNLPDSELIIASDGPQRQALERLVYNLNLGDKVKFLGFIDESKKASLLSSASVACFPSLYGESFGVVLVEAMAAGSGLVLGGDNPGYRSVLGAKPALLVDPRNPNEFAKRLVRFLSDEILVSSLHNWQTKEVSKYDVDKVAPQVLETYYRAVAKQQNVIHN